MTHWFDDKLYLTAKKCTHYLNNTRQKTTQSTPHTLRLQKIILNQLWKQGRKQQRRPAADKQGDTTVRRYSLPTSTSPLYQPMARCPIVLRWRPYRLHSLDSSSQYNIYIDYWFPSTLIILGLWVIIVQYSILFIDDLQLTVRIY